MPTGVAVLDAAVGVAVDVAVDATGVKVGVLMGDTSVAVGVAVGGSLSTKPALTLAVVANECTKNVCEKPVAGSASESMASSPALGVTNVPLAGASK